MYAKSEYRRRATQARGRYDGETSTGRSARSGTTRQSRQTAFSRPQLLREFELLMLTALVETARRDRSA